MNADLLLEHYERIADAPDAVARLRQFVLTLAVRGKLLPQDPSDEPAAQLLNKLEPLPKPARYEKRSVDVIPGNCGLSINNPKIPVPVGWQWVPLVKIAKLESGHTPSRTRPDWWIGDIPWVGLVDARAHNNGTIFETIQHTNQDGLANSAARLLPKGTVCFSRTASVGYVVVLGRAMATSQDFVNWVPTSVISSAWLQLVMIAERPAIDRFSKGAVHQTIYFPAWLSMFIVLPPLAEQHRIVAKVDELMALCDRLEAARTAREATRDRLAAATLARLNTPDPETFPADVTFALEAFPFLTARPDQIKHLRQKILSLAVRGKLHAQDANDESTEELLKRIKKEKARLAKAGEAKVEKRLELADPYAEFEIPKSWAWTRLGLITSCIQRGKSPKYATENGSLVISQRCVQWSGLDLNVAKKVTFESLADYEAARFLRNDDLLWNSTGTGTIGRIIRLVNPPDKLVCDSHVTLIRCLDVNPEYIRIWLRSDYVYAVIEDRAAGSTNQVELTAQMAINQIVPLPPLAEQHRIVAKVDALMALCDRLEASLTASAAARRRLLDALLAEALEPAVERELEDVLAAS